MRRVKDNSNIEGSHIARIYRPQSGVTEKINVNIDSANSRITVGSWSANGTEADECISEIYSTYDRTGDFNAAIQSFIGDSKQLKHNKMKRVKDSGDRICLYGVYTEEYPELNYIEDGIKHSYSDDDTIVDWVVGEMEKHSDITEDYGYSAYDEPTYMRKKVSPDGRFTMYYDGEGTIEIWCDEFAYRHGMSVYDSRRIRDAKTKRGEHQVGNSNLIFCGVKKNPKGNAVFMFRFDDGGQSFSLPAPNDHLYAHGNADHFIESEVETHFDSVKDMDNFFIDYVQKHGSERQKNNLMIYKNKKFADSRRVRDNWMVDAPMENFSAISGFATRSRGHWNEKDTIEYGFGTYIEDDYEMFLGNLSFPLSSVNDIPDVIDGVINALNGYIDNFDFDYWINDMKENLNPWIEDITGKPYTDDELRAMVQEGYDYLLEKYDFWVNKIKPWQEQVRDMYVNDSRRVKDAVGIISEDLEDAINAELSKLGKGIQVWHYKSSDDRVIIATDNGMFSKNKDVIKSIMSDFGYTYNKSYPMLDSSGTMAYIAVFDKKVSDSRCVRSLTRRIKDSVKMKNVRKRITDAKAKYFTNDLKRMQAYRRVTDSKGKIKENVVFLIEDSDVLAVFPNTYGTANRDRDTMVCYSHNGQHGVCTYDYANTLKTADSKNYDALKDELTNYVGYNLTIVDSLPSETELKQNAKEIRDAYIKYKRGLQIADERMLARGEEIQYKGKRGTVQYALFHGQEPVVIRWQNDEGSEEFEIPYNEVSTLKIHDSEDDDVNIETVDNDSDIDDAEVTDNCGGKKKGKGKKKTADGVKCVKITKRQTKKTE